MVADESGNDVWDVLRASQFNTSAAADEGQTMRSVANDVADGRRPGRDKDREDSRRHFKAESFKVSC